jgi:hypothetical protein
MYYGEFVAYNGAYAGYIYSAKGGNYQMMTFASITPSAVKGDGTDVLRFEAVGSSLKLFFNDQLVTYAYDSGLTTGAAGLWGGYEKSLGTPHSFVLDNFSATAVTLNNVTLPFTDAFGTGNALSRSWTERSGSFSINAQQQLKADNSALNLATVNHAATANLSVQANLILKTNTPGKTSLEYGGLVARFQDNNNLYVAEFVSYYDGSQYSYAGYIFLVKGGTWSLLKYGTVADPNFVKRDGTDLLKFDTNGASLTLSLNGQQLATTNDTTLSSGVSGVWGGPGFGLDNFGVQAV